MTGIPSSMTLYSDTRFVIYTSGFGRIWSDEAMEAVDDEKSSCRQD